MPRNATYSRGPRALPSSTLLKASRLSLCRTKVTRGSHYVNNANAFLNDSPVRLTLWCFVCASQPAAESDRRERRCPQYHRCWREILICPLHGTTHHKHHTHQHPWPFSRLDEPCPSRQVLRLACGIPFVSSSQPGLFPALVGASISSLEALSPT